MSGGNPVQAGFTEGVYQLLGQAEPTAQQMAQQLGLHGNVILHESATDIEYFRANLRALRLLWKHLTPAQRAQYKLFDNNIDLEGRSFIVRGNQTGAHYRIFFNGNVLRLRDQHRFCLKVGFADLPTADMMLAKKLLLETDERLFLATANDLTLHGIQQRAVAAIQQRAVDWLGDALANRPPPTEPDNTGRRGRAWNNQLGGWVNRLRQW